MVCLIPNRALTDELDELCRPRLAANETADEVGIGTRELAPG